MAISAAPSADYATVVKKSTFLIKKNAQALFFKTYVPPANQQFLPQKHPCIIRRMLGVMIIKIKDEKGQGNTPPIPI